MKSIKILFSDQPISLYKGIAIIRIIIGLLMLYHGLEVFDPAIMEGYLKWEVFHGPQGKLLVYLGKSSELLIGIFLALGFYTRLASLLLMGTLGYITFVVGNGRFWYQDQHPFLFVLFGLLFFLTGPGSWSLRSLLNQGLQVGKSELPDHQKYP